MSRYNNVRKQAQVRVGYVSSKDHHTGRIALILKMHKDLDDDWLIGISTTYLEFSGVCRIVAAW